MHFDWFTQHRRHKITEAPFPSEWLDVLHKNMPVYALLTQDEQARLRDDLRIFLAEKSWEGCGGLQLTEAMQVTIAAQACLLLLHREHNYFANVSAILVYPNDYHAPDRGLDASGVMAETLSDRAGEAWSNGSVVLSWRDVEADGRHPDEGRNVVYHEFAHELDMTDGEMNGVPLLEDEAQVEAWGEVMSAEFEALSAAVAEGKKTSLDAYGATNAAEFFAVVTEAFFDRPAALRAGHPALYHLLEGYYHQDPAARLDTVHAHMHAT